MAAAADHWRAARPVMGTMASLHVADNVSNNVSADRVREAAEATFDELERLEAMFSTFRPTSEISRINAGQLQISDASSEVIDVFDACTWLGHASSGAFSIEPPERPGRIDPAGFVKGWATERATRKLTEAGLTGWYLGLGGDIQTSGRPTPERGWSVAIADPLTPGEVRATLELPIGYAIATSGTAERANHLWTASNQLPLASVTVVGPRLTWADAFATTAYAMGVDGLAWVEQFDGYQAWAITRTGELLGQNID